MTEKQKTLEQIINLMDRENISAQEIADFRQTYHSSLARKWVKSEHKPGWFITDNGFYSPNPPAKGTNFGIWITETLIFYGKVMYKENTFAAAQDFIYNTMLGPFYCRIPFEGESYALTGHSSLISAALKRCGLQELPDKFYWFNRKIVLEGEELVYMNHTKENLLNYDKPEAEHMALFVVSITWKSFFQ